MTSDPVRRFLLARGLSHGSRAGLRPRDGSELLDGAYRTCQAIGFLLLRASAIPAVLLVCVLTFVDAFVLSNFGWTKDGAPLLRSLETSAAAVGVSVFVGLPLALLAVALSTSVVARLTADSVEGSVPDLGRSVGEAAARLPSLSVVAVLQALASSLGFLAMFFLFLLAGWLTQQTSESSPVAGLVAVLAFLSIVPAFLWFVFVESKLGLSIPIVALETTSARHAGKRSAWLLRRHPNQRYGAGTVWSFYFAGCFVALATYTMSKTGLDMITSAIRPASALGPDVGRLLESLFGLLPLFFSAWLTLPLYGVFVTLLYYDRRIRLEGYDVDTLIDAAHRARRVSRFQL